MGKSVLMNSLFSTADLIWTGIALAMWLRRQRGLIYHLKGL
jgi:hypothetical protein